MSECLEHWRTAIIFATTLWIQLCFNASEPRTRNWIRCKFKIVINFSAFKDKLTIIWRENHAHTQKERETVNARSCTTSRLWHRASSSNTHHITRIGMCEWNIYNFSVYIFYFVCWIDFLCVCAIYYSFLNFSIARSPPAFECSIYSVYISVRSCHFLIISKDKENKQPNSRVSNIWSKHGA